MMKFCNPFLAAHLVCLLFTLSDADPKSDAPKAEANPPKQAEKRAPDAQKVSAAKDKPAGSTEKDADGKKEADSKNADDKTKADDKTEELDQQGEANAVAIKKTAHAFEKAFNDHDAKAVAASFALHAEIIDADGTATQGRENIEQSFAEYFEENPDAKIRTEIDSIRSLGPSLMIEEGTTYLTSNETNPQEIVHYTVIYSKAGDQWLMSYARDTSSEEAIDENIKNLTWLIGDWMDESDDSTVITKYRWSSNKKAIEGEFHIHAAGYPSLDGTLRIGWDPQAKQLRSWVFDSEGGFGSGLWSRTDAGWMVKMTGVLRDGRVTSATNMMRRESGDHLVFQSVDRSIGGVMLPDGDELSVVRHAPPPDSVSVNP